jgi:hypothetical protein
MDWRRVGSEGVIVGLLGASAIALWFLIIDTIAGQPLFTPAMLGSAIFWGARSAADVQIGIPTVLAYTMVHVLAFVVVGVIASAVACQAERSPSTLFVAVVLFAAFAFGFFTLWFILGPPLLGQLAWWSVAVGDGIAGVIMAFYIWRRHPVLRARLAEHPLGAAVESSDTWDKA